ncbi:MAG: hypothetical protein RLO51_26145 [Thalassobaculum sp.]|uniref:hypothetical protein n=1 Tax=Thalassobaculum sp. TaxID=2022740 RepID=UPI0032EE0838
MGIFLAIIGLLTFIVLKRITVGYGAALQERDGLTDSQARVAQATLVICSFLAALLVVVAFQVLTWDPYGSDRVAARMAGRPINPGQPVAFALLTVIVALSYIRFRLGRLPIEKFIDKPTYMKTGKDPMETAEESLEAYRRSKRERARRKDAENLRKYGTRFPDD